MAELVGDEVVGRNVIAGRRAFPPVEDFDGRDERSVAGVDGAHPDGLVGG